ncbi:hypothetical protein ACFFP0_23990, partial [Rhizobium puerariae]
IHSLQLPLHPPAKDGWSDETGGGSKLDAGHPARGVNIPRRNTFKDFHRGIDMGEIMLCFGNL